eukprot:scaffold99990_cov39-Cyclotella_meneghiniana.AAC.3
MLSSWSEWTGLPGQAGQRALFLEEVDSASKMANDYFLRHTIPGPLREFLFWTDLFTYLNDDLEWLVQFQIPVQECLVLISSESSV